MRKKRERKIRINLKALEETSMFVFLRTKNFNLFFVSVQVSAFIGLLDSLVYATRFKSLLTLVFQRFVVNFAILLLDSSKFTRWTPFWILFSFTSMFLIYISSLYYLPEFRNVFLVFLIFSFCSRSVLLSTLWGPSRVLGYFHPVE